jgi:hypothetical protein
LNGFFDAGDDDGSGTMYGNCKVMAVKNKKILYAASSWQCQQKTGLCFSSTTMCSTLLLSQVDRGIWGWVLQFSVAVQGADLPLETVALLLCCL